MAGRDFNYIKEKYTEAGARQEFESICYSLICKLHPQEQVHKIRPHPGDSGIDIFYDDMQNSICCFQCKFFLGVLTPARRKQINESFTTFVKEHQDIPQKSWTLCLPDTLTHEDMKWWKNWSLTKKDDHHIRIELYDGDRLLNDLREQGLYDQFFDIADPNGFEAILKSVPPIIPSNNLFHYSCPQMPMIFGRDEELQSLTDFLHTDDCFSFWGITGPAGVGKSKIVYYFSQLRNLSDWRFVFVPKNTVKELTQSHSYDLTQNTCLIIDYANEVSAELADLFRFLASYHNEKGVKLRILLIAREGMKEVHYYEENYPNWFLEILKPSESLINLMFKPELLALQGISKEDYIGLADAYCTAFSTLPLSDTDRAKIWEYIFKELSDSNSKVEPLYILFSVNAFLYDKTLNHWNKQELLKSVYLRNYRKWKQEINDEELLSALLNMLLYATIVGEWDPNKNAPHHLQQSANTLCRFIEHAPTGDIVGYYTTLTGRYIFRDRHYILPSLSPDIVGEYYVLESLNKLTSLSRDGWICFFVEQFVACKDFFLRSIQNYGDDECFGHTIVGLFEQILKYIEREKNQDEILFGMLTSLLGSYYSNFKGSSDPSIFKELIRLIDSYSERYQNCYLCWAELKVAFRLRNTSSRLYPWRLKHFETVSSLHQRWPESALIAREYVSFLGNLIEDSVGKANQIDEGTGTFLTLFDYFIGKHKEYRDVTVAKNTLVACIHVVSAISQIENANPLLTMYSERIQEIIRDDYSRAELMICYIENVDSLLLQLAKARNDAEIGTTILNTKQYIKHCLEVNSYLCFWISLPIITQSIVNLCSYQYVEEATELSHYFFQLIKDGKYRELRDYMVFHHEESAINRIFKSSYTPNSIREIFIEGSEPYAF